MTNPLRGGEMPDYVKFQCMRQLNQELLERLKASQEENVKLGLNLAFLESSINKEANELDLLLQGNGKEESLREGPPNLEEGEGEEQAIQEVERQGGETEEGKEIEEN
jgi:hypothetical protein